MWSEGWLNQDSQFVAGQEIFRSEREFAVWAYTVSHGQLLLRATGRPRIDVLFKNVSAMKVRAEYDGLVIRCATEDESERPGERLLVLGDSDYVVAGAVGWREDDGRDNEPSSLAFFPPAADPHRVLPTGGSAE